MLVCKVHDVFRHQCSGSPSLYSSMLPSSKWNTMRREHQISSVFTLESLESCPGMQVDFLCWQQHTWCQGRWNMSGDYRGTVAVGGGDDTKASGVWQSQPWLSTLSCWSLKKNGWAVDWVSIMKGHLHNIQICEWKAFTHAKMRCEA